MSLQLVEAYFNEIDRLKKFSGTTTEGVISEAFKDLLKAWSGLAPVSWRGESLGSGYLI
jgi:hypothetical protein